MKFTSNILGEVASAIRRSVIGPFETEIQIMPMVMNAQSLRNAMRTIGGGAGGSLVQTTSFVTNGGVSVINAGSTAATICTIDEGLWEIELYTCYGSNYPTDRNSGGNINLDFNGGVLAVQLNNMFCLPTGGGFLNSVQKFRINLDQVVAISTHLGANGVGQEHSMQIAVMGHKIL